MNQGSRRGPISPANCPGRTRPVLWTSFSGRTTAGGRLFGGGAGYPRSGSRSLGTVLVLVLDPEFEDEDGPDPNDPSAQRPNDPTAAPATAAMEGQSAGRGRFGSKPGGRSDRPVSKIW